MTGSSNRATGPQARATHSGRRGLALVAIAYVSFVALGMPGGMLGVAWPSTMRSYGRSLDDVGAVLLALTAGSLLSSLASGPAIARTGSGWFLAVSSVVASLGLVGFAAAPNWWVVVGAAFVLGIAAGGVDSVLNVYFAENHGSRLMSWLHACFGLGATIGPAIMTALIVAGRSWRWGYAAVAVAQLGLAVMFGLTARRWREPAPREAQPDRPAARTARPWSSLALPIVWLGLGLMVLAAGVESVAAQWPYSLFTEERDIAPAVAGLWASVYWGALTVGRILYGLAGPRLNHDRSLRAGIIAVVVGSALLSVRSVDLAAFLGLALSGLAIAPVIPLVQLDTPERVGPRHTANAIGFQTAAGYVGVGVLPALAGYMAEQRSLETIGPFMVICGLAMLVLHEAIVRAARAVRGRASLLATGPGSDHGH